MINKSVPALHEMSEPIQQEQMPSYLDGESPNMSRSSQSRRFDMGAGLEEAKADVTRSHGFSEYYAHAELEELKEVPAPAEARDARRLRTEEEEGSAPEYGTLESPRATQLSYTRSKDADDPKSSSIFVKSPLSSSALNKS